MNRIKLINQVWFGLMLCVYIVLALSFIVTCAPNKHVGNERENRKGLLPNNRKGLLPNKQHELFVPKLILNYQNNLFQIVKSLFEL